MAKMDLYSSGDIEGGRWLAIVFGKGGTVAVAAFAMLGHMYAFAAASSRKGEQQDGKQGEG